MRISDWSSDVCSSDLLRRELQRGVAGGVNRGLVGLPQLQARGFVAQLRAGVERVELRIEARDGLVAGADAQPRIQFRYALAGRHAAGVALQAQRHDRLVDLRVVALRSDEHTSELQSLMRISYAV